MLLLRAFDSYYLMIDISKLVVRKIKEKKKKAGSLISSSMLNKRGFYTDLRLEALKYYTWNKSHCESEGPPEDHQDIICN